MNPVILSYGLGVDSTAILLRWLREPETRGFNLSDLTIVTAMTGDEWAHTKRDVEFHILPLIRDEGIRYVQVARGQRYVTKGAGVEVLSDTILPYELHLAGSYRLSEEMLSAGTVPQSGGARLCSVHAKGDVLDPTIAGITDGRPYRHVVGFEANEQSRAIKDAKFNTELRLGVYPLIEWGWDRQRCLDYIQDVLGVEWHKSACVYCPFSLQNKTSVARQLELYRQHPEAAVQALFMEEVSLALNPTQSLIPKKPLANVLIDAGLTEPFSLLNERLDREPHAVYEVRRILRGRKDDPTKLANAARSIRIVSTGTRTESFTSLLKHAWRLGLGMPETDEDGFQRLYLRQRGDTFPATEHFYTVAPAVAHDKQHDRFEQWWSEAA